MIVEVNIEKGLHKLVISALEEADYSVETMVTMLANEIKYVVRNYEDD